MTGWLYWTLFVAACVVVSYGIPWACSRLEEREDEIDRRIWRGSGGGRW